MTDDEPISVHGATPVIGYLRSQALPLFFAGCALIIGVIGFTVPSKEGPVVSNTIGAACMLAVVACLVWSLIAYFLLIRYVVIYPDRVEWRDGRGEQVAG